ncbi:MAG: prepilin peptidase, partial [Elusimicrobia bacterium]|nr:prepilin peptidase [Elusimicrobiota bacterium]
GSLLLFTKTFYKGEGDMPREAMGGGDIKLAAGLGSFLGWEYTLIMLGLSFLVGGSAGIVLLISGRKKRKDPIPFGPFIAFSAIMVMLFGESISAWLTARLFV